MLKKKIAMVLVLSAALAQPIYAQDINVSVNGTQVSFSNQQPVIVDGRTLIPLRGVFENLGYSVSWDGNTKTATLENDNYTIKIQSDSSTFTVNSQTKTLDVPAQIINGSMMIPLRAVGEGTGVTVNWDASTKSASISSPVSSIENKSLGDFTLDELNEISAYLDGYTSAVAPFETIMSEMTSAFSSNNLQDVIKALENLKVSAVTARTNLNNLKPPTVCDNIHKLSLENLDLLDEFADYVLSVLSNPSNIPADFNEKLGDYLSKFNNIKSQIDSEVQKWENLANS